MSDLLDTTAAQAWHGARSCPAILPFLPGHVKVFWPGENNSSVAYYPLMPISVSLQQGSTVFASDRPTLL